MKKFNNKILLILAMLSFAPFANADGLTYIGLGKGKAEGSHTNKVPWAKDAVTVGYIQLNNPNYLWGFDIGKEGSSQKSVAVGAQIEQRRTINGIIGKNMSKGSNTRFDLGLIGGIAMEQGSSKANLGAIAMYGYGKIHFGLRVTKFSNQIVIGYKF